MMQYKFCAIVFKHDLSNLDNKSSTSTIYAETLDLLVEKLTSLINDKKINQWFLKQSYFDRYIDIKYEKIEYIYLKLLTIYQNPVNEIAISTH